ncbi:putative methionyl-tRNA synthetase [Hordeum vulgare]|nr:putative methionyl-tRNA synthetase [Hordeum vulgare]
MFSRTESCEKWRDVRLALTKPKGTYNPNAPVPAASKGRLDGNKRAKGTRDAAPAVERLQSSVEQWIANTKNNAAKREEKSNARWSALMTKQDVKLDLLRTNVATKKKNTDLSFLMVAYMSTINEQVKDWYLAECGLILNQMLVPAVTTTATPTTTPSPSTENTPTPSLSPTTPTHTPTPASPAP